MTGPSRIRVDPIACTGHGICAELLPDLIRLDDWGYPIIEDVPVDPRYDPDIRRAITARVVSAKASLPDPASDKA
jgi:ferredoxin